MTDSTKRHTCSGAARPFGEHGRVNVVSPPQKYYRYFFVSLGGSCRLVFMACMGFGD
jgi:hypothetical protein